MPAPTNVSFATATNIPTLPATVTQRVDDAGTTYTVFYKFTAPTDAVVIGAFGFGDLVVYKPTIEPYDVTQTGVLGISLQNKPIQFPVTAGALYYLKLVTNAGNPSPANLSLTVQVAPSLVVSAGSIAVNDDQTGFPLAIVSSAVNYTPLRFVATVINGESGDTLNDGSFLLEDANTGNALLYDASYALTATITLPSGSVSEPGAIRTCTRSQRFYVGNSQNPPKFLTVTNGIASSMTTLTGSTGLATLAASNDETILYHATGNAGAAVERWDITNNVALSNLVAGVGTDRIADIIVLLDDTILVSYYQAAYTIIRYSAAGGTLNTYAFGAYALSKPRMATALDDPLSFWVMKNDAAGGTKAFRNVQVSDGTVLRTIAGVIYASGESQATATATPLTDFGTSNSCPMWIVRAQPDVTTQTFTIRRQRRFLLPSSPDNKFMQIPTIELLMRTGIGLTPDAWNSDANVPQGANPQVMTRISKDGGKTWSPERWMSAGKIGEYLNRVRVLRATGNYRNAVFEVTVSDPVDWQMLAAMGMPVEGSS